MKDTLGRPRASHRRDSDPLGSVTNRVGGRLGCASEAVKISMGRCAWMIDRGEEAGTKIAEK
jgi:hypothetical protein